MEAADGQPAARQRLFVAVDLDDAVRAACAAVAERLRAAGFAGKWVRPENYHLTVAFLGGVDADRLGAIATALEHATTRIDRFFIRLDIAGAYPNERRARIAWVGPAGGSPAFARLSTVVRSALTEIGFALDRDADPHVTLARSDRRRALPRVDPPVTPPLAVEALTLYRSFTERAGARYVALTRVPLRGSGP